MARLISALSGQRYCLPWVGQSNDWKIPCGHEPFPLQSFIGLKLLALRQDDQGNWHPYKDDRGEYVESPAPVSGFVANNHEVRTFGSLQDIMDEDGWVKVSFGKTPLQESFYEAPLIDISGVSTPPTPKLH